MARFTTTAVPFDSLSRNPIASLTYLDEVSFIDLPFVTSEIPKTTDREALKENLPRRHSGHSQCSLAFDPMIVIGFNANR